MSSTFAYQLESLLKKRLLDQDVARAEEAAARELMEAHRTEAGLIEKTIDVTEQELRGQYTRGRELDLEQQQLLLTYLTHQRKELEKKRAKLAHAVTVHEDTARNLEAACCSVKTLEKHKEGRHAEFFSEWRRAEQKRVDELWLMREHRGERSVLYRQDE
jgi:hypothetical protein